MTRSVRRTVPARVTGVDVDRAREQLTECDGLVGEEDQRLVHDHLERAQQTPSQAVPPGGPPWPGGGRWEKALDGGTWETDFDLTYRRIGEH